MLCRTYFQFGLCLEFSLMFYNKITRGMFDEKRSILHLHVLQLQFKLLILN